MSVKDLPDVVLALGGLGLALFRPPAFALPTGPRLCAVAAAEPSFVPMGLAPLAWIFGWRAGLFAFRYPAEAVLFPVPCPLVLGATFPCTCLCVPTPATVLFVSVVFAFVFVSSPFEVVCSSFLCVFFPRFVHTSSNGSVGWFVVVAVVFVCGVGHVVVAFVQVRRSATVGCVLVSLHHPIVSFLPFVCIVRPFFLLPRFARHVYGTYDPEAGAWLG
mmetsp:Transcript_50/g.444  ORF Transcript_50/g.444 Transcript_50/m.444 type:complete len:217 (-) Transcript_50:198-848(-)